MGGGSSCPIIFPKNDCITRLQSPFRLVSRQFPQQKQNKTYLMTRRPARGNPLILALHSQDLIKILENILIITANCMERTWWVPPFKRDGLDGYSGIVLSCREELLDVIC